MKSLLAGIVMSATLLAQSSAQAPKAAPAKPAGAASPATRTALLHPALLKAKAPDEFQVKFTTSVGDFVVDVHRAWAPLGADRFYNLVKNGYFTNAAFFRVIPRFVVQFGLNPSAAVNHAWHDARIQDDPVTHTNKKGSIVFATSGPNTRTTQLFINYVDNPRLDGMGFAPFGEVTEGMEIVEKIFPGYTERPDQQQITDEGDAYLTKNFPEIDRIKTARIVPPTPAAAPAKVASKPAAKPASN